MGDATIEVNGNTIPWSEGMTVTDVLAACNYVFPLVVVDVNGRQIARKDYPRADVPQGAVVNVVHLISGG
jgi:sulfur carrier protein